MSQAHDWEFEAGHDPVLMVSGENGSRWAVGERPGVLRLEADRDLAQHFDPAGRIINIQEDGASYRRTLDHRLLVSRILRERGRRQGWERLEAPEDSLGFLAAAHAHAAALREMVDRGARIEVLSGQVDDPRAWLRQRLEGPASWKRESLERDAAELQRLYRPIPILPPDHYSSLVLQLTEGCAWNRCGFCNFYSGVSYRERELEEFLHHVDGVLRHLGGTLARLHRVFLGQANALLVDNDRLLPMLDGIAERIPLLSPYMGREERRRFKEEQLFWVDGFYSFIDGFHRQKSAAEYRALAEAGVRRVYLGLESGSPEVLRLLEKPPAVDAAVELVHALHAADIQVGVILLVGAGGLPYAQRHQDETLEVLQRMELNRGDQVYLSRLVVHEGGPYEERARRDGLQALDRAAQDAQIAALRASIRRDAKGPIAVAPYEINLSRSLVPMQES